MSGEKERTDGELLAAAAAKDGPAFAAVFLVAHRFRPRGTGLAGPWVRGIAQNKLRESRRRGRVEARARRRLAFEPEALDDDDLTRVEELAADGAAGAMDLVDGLPERQRAAVRTHVVDARSYAEIAGELSCSELVVRQRVSRGLSRLRNELTERKK